MNNNIYILLNEQIQKELYSSYLYLDMSNYYGSEGLNGFANWFYVQAQEEMDHAMLFRSYLMNNEQNIKLLSIDAPQGKYDDFSQPLTLALAHEKYVTASINTIYETSFAAGDYRTLEFVNWFVKEQGEEEKNIGDLIKKFELFGSDAKSLYQLNQELAARVYSAPSLVIN